MLWGWILIHTLIHPCIGYLPPVYDIIPVVCCPQEVPLVVVFLHEGSVETFDSTMGLVGGNYWGLLFPLWWCYIVLWTGLSPILSWGRAVLYCLLWWCMMMLIFNLYVYFGMMCIGIFYQWGPIVLSILLSWMWSCGAGVVEKSHRNTGVEGLWWSCCWQISHMVLRMSSHV